LFFFLVDEFMGFGSKRDEDLVFQKNKIEFLIFLSFGFEDG